MKITLPKKITICEVGPRDGLQNEPRVLSVEEKVGLINRSTDAGFKIIEVGSFMNPVAVPQMAETDEVFRRIHRKSGVEYRALIANLKGVDRAIACGCSKVKMNVSASAGHNIANLNKTPKESMAGFKACAEKARSNGLEISGSISMPFGSPWEHRIPLETVIEIVATYLDAGIKELSLSDASGMAMPNQVFSVCAQIKEKYPDVRWILHFHNTRGMGIANIVAGMQAGVDCFDASFGGIGGCPFVPGAAGNVATEEVLHMCDEMGIETGIDLDRVIETARAVQELLGRDLPSSILKAGKNSDLLANR